MFLRIGSHDLNRKPIKFWTFFIILMYCDHKWNTKQEMWIWKLHRDTTAYDRQTYRSWMHSMTAFHHLNSQSSYCWVIQLTQFLWDLALSASLACKSRPTPEQNCCTINSVCRYSSSVTWGRTVTSKEQNWKLTVQGQANCKQKKSAPCF